MLRIPRDRLTYEFSAATEPVARIAPGTTLVLETHDTSTGRVRRAEDLPTFLRVRDPHMVNPAAGPIYVEGANPGDDLVVEILDIRLQPSGFVRVHENGAPHRQGRSARPGEPALQLRPVIVTLPHLELPCAEALRPQIGSEPLLGPAPLARVPQVDRRRALGVDEEPAKPWDGAAEGGGVVGRALDGCQVGSRRRVARSDGFALIGTGGQNKEGTGGGRAG